MALQNVEESAQFKNLPPAVREMLYQDMAKNGIGDAANPMTFNLAPSKELGISNAVTGTVFANDTDNTNTAVGPLSRGQVQALATPEEAAPEQQGALTATAPAAHQPIDIAAMIRQFAPQDDSRSRYMAMAAGFGSTTKTGSLGEQIGNVANAMQAQKSEQDKLRSQYIPLIMQQVAGQQAREEQAQYHLQAQQQAQAASALAQKDRLAQAAQQSEQARQLQLAIAQGNQGLRADANAVSRAHLFTAAMAQYPFGIPQAVMDQINATVPQTAGSPLGTPGTPMPGASPTAPGQPSGAPTPQPSPQQAQSSPNQNIGSGPLFGPGSKTDGLTGSEFLAAIPANISQQIKALAEGKLAPPNGMAAKSPYWQALLQATGQYDPTFDTTDYAKRASTAKAFSAGRQGDAVRSVNQTISHMGSLSDAIDNLNNTGGLGTITNGPVNLVQEKVLGDSRQGVFRQRVQAVSSELRKVFSGAGGGSLEELKQWENSIPENASMKQQQDYLRSGVELLHGAISALNTQYQTGMGPSADLLSRGLITPKSQAILDRITGAAKPPSSSAGVAPPDLKALAAAEVARRAQTGQ